MLRLLLNNWAAMAVSPSQTKALRMLGWPYGAIGELWNKVLTRFERRLPNGTISNNIRKLMQEIREPIRNILFGLQASDRE